MARPDSDRPSDAEDLQPTALPRGPLGALDELLHRPREIFGRARQAGPSSLFYLGAAAIGCFVLYGVASGFFQGGSQVLVTALKAPLILLASLVLCAPSFYVLSSLQGAEVTPRWLAANLIGLAGMLGLLLVALMPITWLFSVSSESLAFIVILHLVVWIIAIHFGYKFLNAAHGDGESRPSMAWMLLFVLVSLQVTSQMRPVLWRAEGEALFAPQKMFFLEHFADVAAGKGAAPRGE